MTNLKDLICRDNCSGPWIKMALGLILGMFTVLFFIPSLKMPFFWDDVFLIEHNPYLEKNLHAGEVFYKQELTSGGAKNQNFEQHVYRPLRTLYFMAVTRVFGKSSVHFHLLTLLSHLLVVLLLWRIFQREAQSSSRSLFWPSILCLWFLFHPVHLENINMISGVSDIFGSVLFLLLVLFLHQRTKLSWTETVWIAFVSYCAMLFKEMFITLPVILFLLFRPINSLQGITLLLVSGLYYVQRLLIIPHVAQIDLSMSFTERAAYTAKTFFYYLYLFFCPQFPSEDYLCPSGGMPHEGWIVLFLLLISGVALGCLLKKTRGLAFYGAAFMVSMLPILHLIPINTFVNDRLFYFPSVMGILLFSKIEGSFKDSRTQSQLIFRWTGLILVIIFSTTGFLQNQKWNQPQKIWQEAWEKTGSIRCLWNMVYEMERIENYQELLDYFQGKPIFIPEDMHCFYYQELCFASVSLNKKNDAKAYLKVLQETLKNPAQREHYREKDLRNLVLRLREISSPLSSEITKEIEQAEIFSKRE